MDTPNDIEPADRATAETSSTARAGGGRITKYNLIAGQSIERLAALSDGVFAVAMTLLVLGLAVPPKNTTLNGKPVEITSDSLLIQALAPVALHLIPYVMSFLTLGIFWVGQQTQLNFLKRSNRNLTWIYLGFLLCVTLMPFSTGLLASYSGLRTAVVVYWLNIALLGAVLYITLRYAMHAGVLNDEATPAVTDALLRRIVIAQALYAAGALLCVVSTYLSIGAIFLVQVNYVIAPRIRLLYRL